MLCRKVVDRTGDKTKAAGLLGISKPTLYNKLKS
jgi:transcriptional regulator with PAS, ATPase and Fis domain